MEQSINAKPGEIWLRRDGGRACIYAVDGTIHGAISCYKDSWIPKTWTKTGSFWCEEGSPYDLIQRYDWREELAPIWAVLKPEWRWVAMMYTDLWIAYTKKPERTIHRFVPEGLYSTTTLRMLRMPTPDCPWYETLTERP